jgi:hypothetical protein
MSLLFGLWKTQFQLKPAERKSTICKAISSDFVDKKLIYFLNGYRYKDETTWKRYGNS